MKLREEVLQVYIFHFTEAISDIYCQNKDTVDFHYFNPQKTKRGQNDPPVVFPKYLRDA